MSDFDIKKTMTKKALKELNSKKRVHASFNTGTRDMKSDKYPSRQELNKICRDYGDER